MKRVVAILLVTAMLLSLCACGTSGKDNNSPVAELTSALSPNKTTMLEFGTAVETDFVEFTFQSAVVDYKIGGDNGHRPATEGMQFFCLVGTVLNTAGSELNITNVAGTMTFNDKYSYSVNGNAVYGEKILHALPALVEGDFLIYAEVPYALLDQMVDCKVDFSFEENFEAKPEKTGKFH